MESGDWEQRAVMAALKVPILVCWLICSICKKYARLFVFWLVALFFMDNIIRNKHLYFTL